MHISWIQIPGGNVSYWFCNYEPLPILFLTIREWLGQCFCTFSYKETTSSLHCWTWCFCILVILAKAFVSTKKKKAKKKEITSESDSPWR